MAPLELVLFGGFQARAAGHAIEVPGRKERALLALLAMPPGEPRSRDKLAGLLWSDRGDKQARDSLKQAILRLRKSFDSEHALPLIAGRETVTLDRHAVAVDVAEFELLISEATPEAIARAIALYRGDLLDGFDVRDSAFNEWLVVERQRLRELARDALAGLLDKYMARNAHDQAGAVARRLLMLDPLREVAHRALMQIYAEQGQTALALKQYQLCCDALKSELGIRPEAETERLYRSIQEKRATAFRTPSHPASAKPSETSEPPLEPSPPTLDPRPGDGKQLPLQDRPSIAVLPFDNMSADPEQQFFADGLTEDIITELSRFRDLFVIARHSCFQYRDKSLDVKSVGRELGARFVVEGSFRRSSSRVRISAQLIDAETGNHLWAERYDRDLADILILQEELAHTIAATISGRVDAAGRDRATRLGPAGLKAYDLILRGEALQLNFNRIDMKQAHALALRAIEIDPTNARAHVLYAACCFNLSAAYWTAERDRVFEEAVHHARRAVALDSSDSVTQHLLGFLNVFRREYEEARIHCEKALESNPNDTDARTFYALFLIATGQPDAAIEQLDLVKRHNPFDLYWVPWVKGIAFFTAHRYEEAIALLKQIPEPINEIRGWLAASYAQADRFVEAKASLDEFLRVAKHDMVVYPGDRLKDWGPYWHAVLEYRDQRDFDHLFEGLRKAGMPE